MIFYSTLALSSFLISLLGTRLTILALRKRITPLDIARIRSGRTPTPHGGGIAVVMAMVICFLVGDISYAIVLSIFILAGVALLNDFIRVPSELRLLAQILSVAIPLATMKTSVFDGILPLWLDKVIVGALWVWFINLFRFMDGIDGISATEMITIGAGLCLIAVFAGKFPHDLSVYSLILGATGAGFLWWNWHPAKIFLGEVGSIPIGFVVFYLLLLASTAGYAFAAFILPAYYIADGVMTQLGHFHRGEKIWARFGHYYQRAVRNGHHHDFVVRRIFGVNLLLMLLAVSSTLNPDIAIFHLAMAYLTVFLLLGFFAHGESGAAAESKP